ncbi:calcium-responsive transcription factor-like [Pocillopora verrucosa]|uniref:calcium-responsive transcription factor-like n=1 Tax=Pocillopora verrucosa TaxID=203993 RepID=UPI003341D17F
MEEIPWNACSWNLITPEIHHRISRLRLKDYSNRSHKILWEDPRDIKGAKIRFTGVPFIILGRKVFDCQHGKDRKAGEKRKREDAEEKAGHKDFVFKKRRFLVQDTRKFDCKAQIKMREILFFAEHKIQEDSKKRRETASRNLRKALEEGVAKYERRIYIELPLITDHQNHFVGEVAGISHPLDEKIIKRIHELVAEGVKEIYEMRRHLKIFVKEVLFRDDQPQTDDTSLGHLTCARTCIELRLKTACQELTRQMSTWRQMSGEKFTTLIPFSFVPTQNK